MKFCIITHVNHYAENEQYFGYAPYVREMNIWLKYVDEIEVVAPLSQKEKSAIDSRYEHSNIVFSPIPMFDSTNFKNTLAAIFVIPKILWILYKAMRRADHIHLRCPGNVGLLGCFVQILFPHKKKTAKYAGNWDLKAKQPLSYRLQKWILNNTFLTRNMQVLVYGEWAGSSKNIKPFFTATYSEKEFMTSFESTNETHNSQQSVSSRSTPHFLFVGTLSEGKRPFYAIQLVEKLVKQGIKATLDLLGEGNQRSVLKNYITENKLHDFVFLHGNQPKDIVKKAYQDSHFLILPSKSEGFPKAVAEAMFWGCVPAATRVSCVPDMLDNGNRGVLLTMNLEHDTAQIEKLLKNYNEYNLVSRKAVSWSQKFTLEKFEEEIQKLLLN